MASTAWIGIPQRGDGHVRRDLPTGSHSNGTQVSTGSERQLQLVLLYRLKLNTGLAVKLHRPVRYAKKRCYLGLYGLSLWVL